MTGVPDTPARVFISYAHESAAHVEAVRTFWILLRTLGVDAHLDRPAAERRDDWPLWMLREVRAAEFVLVIASAAYRVHAEGTAHSGQGRGVQFEATLIRDEVYRQSEAASRKLIAVRLPGADADDVPAFLGPHTGTVHVVDAITPGGVEALVRVLTGQPLLVEPALGEIPHLAPRSAQATSPPLRHVLELDIVADAGRVRCRVTLADTLLGERDAPVPFEVDELWRALSGSEAAATRRLTAAGHQLRKALLDDAAAEHLTQLLDRSPLGTILDIVIEADGDALSLPYELLRLPDSRLVVTVPGVQMRRRLRGIDRLATLPLPGPLKILVAIAAPDESRSTNPPLDIEAEMQAILDALATVATSGAAQVRILEVASPGEITAALAADQYHVLHLAGHGFAHGIELEDEDGNPVMVGAQELAELLRAAMRPLPLVVLSVAAGARGGDDGLAATLVRRGVDRVIAMQAPATDEYATRLARALYDNLAAPRGMEVAAALGAARRVLEDRGDAAVRSGGSPQRPEYAVATLLCVAADPLLVDPAASLAPLALPTVAPAGGGVRRLRLGELIGRRRELRTALAALRGGTDAVERFGAVSGVLLTGMGGVGKSALAGRIMARLADEGWLTVVHTARWSPTAFITSVTDAVGSAGEPFSQAHAYLTTANVDDVAKVQVVLALLAQTRLLVVLDDIDENLHVTGGEPIEFVDPGFAEIFDQMCAVAEPGRVLVTSRYPLPGDAPLLRIAVPPLSSAEVRRLVRRLPALNELDAPERRILMDTIGGNPRLLEFVDALMRSGRGNLREVTRRLRALAGDDVVPSEQRTFADAIRDTIVVGNRDILLDELVDQLGDDERLVLLQAAVSTVPQSVADLAVGVWGESPTEKQHAITMKAAYRLIDLTLLSAANGDEVVVQPWTADALAQREPELASERHERAAAMRLARIGTARGEFDDLLEIARHLAAAGQLETLLSFTQDVVAPVESSLGELSVATFLGEVVPNVPPRTPGFLELAHREAQALLNTGRVAAAAARAQTILDIAHEHADADAADMQAQRNVLVAASTLAAIMVRLGDSEAAMDLYRSNLKLAEQLVAADPVSVQAQRDLAYAHGLLGDLTLQTGDGVQAESLYRESLRILELVAQREPESNSLRADLAVSYNDLANLLFRRGDVAESERTFRRALEILEHVAAAAPDDAGAQRELSIACRRLGVALAELGAGDEAEHLLRRSIEICRRLVAGEPSAGSLSDLAAALLDLGDLLRTTGDSAGAEEALRDCLAIREELARNDLNTEALRDLSISLQALAELLLSRGDASEAEQLLRSSLEIRERVADANPDDARAQRDLVRSHSRLGELAFRSGDREEALSLLQRSVTIAEHLTSADPPSAQAGDDLATAYTELGDLMRQLGDTRQAEVVYSGSLAIRRSLSDADPSNLRAHRDLAAALNKLGGVLGRTEAAIAAYDEVVDRYGDSEDASLRAQTVRALVAKGDALTGLERAEDALAVYRDVADRFDLHPVSELRRHVAAALVSMGRTLAALGRFDEALRTYDEIIARFSEAADSVLRDYAERAVVSKGATLAQLGRTDDIGAQALEVIERATVGVAEKLNAEFERNLREPVRVARLQLRGVDFFADTSWELHRSVNVMLGRNGFGKSLLLRVLAGMLQRDVDATGDVFHGADPSGRLELELLRSGERQRLERDRQVFLSTSVGKVPLLAIPGSRSPDLASTTISDLEELNLVTDGARHFLARLGYQSAVEGLLSGLAFDYLERGQSFEQPVFALIHDVMARLTGQTFAFRRIERVGRTGSRLWVRTEGANRDLEIQRASQGTLSVITIFGLIHAFLQEIALARGLDALHDVHQLEAIVLVDEVDAHLHPAWQQKIRNLLTDTFPNVQFIVSAHSPLVVAGCGPGEVSVLRRGVDAGFSVDRLDEDFVGASTHQLYGRVFEIEDLDEAFLEYAEREAIEPAAERARTAARIDELYAQRESGALSGDEELELERLVRDRGRVARVAKVREQRRSETDRVHQLELTVKRLERELAALRRPDPQ